MNRTRIGCLAVLGLATLQCAAPTVPDNLVIISLDTVRRDHLSTYGYPRDTAPAIDRLASSSLVFDNAVAQDTNTNPSHTSMFTGVYPHVHGNWENARLLAPEQVTLAQILRRAGFRTGGFISGHTMHRRATGLERGFETYEDRLGRAARRDGERTARLALDWLAGLDPLERFFLFVHFYDSHGPYLPPSRLGDLFASEDLGPTLRRIPGYQLVPGRGAEHERLRANPYIDRYDGTIRYVDELVGLLLADLDLEETVVVILSDHGETLDERFHPFDHGGQVFDEQVRIPLIVSAPGTPAGRTDAIVETVDLMPTLLELLDVSLPDSRPVQGTSFAALLRGAAWSGRSHAFSSALARGDRHRDRRYDLDPHRRIHSVRSLRWKLARYPGVERDYLELYELDADPGERRNVADLHPRVVEDYQALLDGWRGDDPLPPAEQQIDPDTLRKLRSLGYVGP